MSNLNDSTVNTMSLLDASLDDMNDMPEWKNFPPGAYTVKPSIKMESKKNTKTGITETHITVGAKLIAVKELADPNDTAPEVGAETQVRYTWENEYGQGGLKNLLKPVAAATSMTKVPELLDAINTADSLVLVMGLRKGKAGTDGSTPEYQTFTNLIVE